jgi:hypothetical protein
MVKRRASWFAPPSAESLESWALSDLRWTIRTELPRGQARVALGLLCLPEDPVSYRDVAEGLGVHVGTVHTNMRRSRIGHPGLHAKIMAERRRQLAIRHAAVVDERRKRSLLWGRRRYAARYRDAHGRWPWDVMRSG